MSTHPHWCDPGRCGCDPLDGGVLHQTRSLLTDTIAQMSLLLQQMPSVSAMPDADPERQAWALRRDALLAELGRRRAADEDGHVSPLPATTVRYRGPGRR